MNILRTLFFWNSLRGILSMFPPFIFPIGKLGSVTQCLTQGSILQTELKTHTAHCTDPVFFEGYGLISPGSSLCFWKRTVHVATVSLLQVHKRWQKIYCSSILLRQKLPSFYKDIQDPSLWN